MLSFQWHHIEKHSRTTLKLKKYWESETQTGVRADVLFCSIGHTTRSSFPTRGDHGNLIVDPANPSQHSLILIVFESFTKDATTHFCEMRTFAVALFALGKQPHQAFSPVCRYSHRLFTSTSLTMSSKKVLVPIADGSEEIETTCITDTLTRFGADVTIASVMPEGGLICKMSRGIKV
jgi:hypothetical protein